jgi:hypothetical protein
MFIPTMSHNLRHDQTFNRYLKLQIIVGEVSNINNVQNIQYFPSEKLYVNTRQTALKIFLKYLK